MNSLLKLLQQRRVARRDLATAAAIRWERQLAKARQEIDGALASLERARLWREAVLNGQGGQGGPAGWAAGEGLLQSCEALVYRQMQAVQQSKAAAEKAHADWQAARIRCRECEQACLRTEEMLAQRRLEEREAAELMEQALAEDIRPPARPGIRSTAALDPV